MKNRSNKIASIEPKSDDGDSKISIFTAFKNFFKFDTDEYHNMKVANQVAIDQSKDLDSQGDKVEINIDEDSIYQHFQEFRNKTASRILVPRSDICAIKITNTESEILATILDNCHTRTLVYQDTMDNIVGFINIKDIFCAIAQKQTLSIKKLLRKHLLVVPSMRLIDLLSEMQKRKTHIAVVIDEYGGTDGIVTIEDIMSEIVGKIDDEHDVAEVGVETFKLLNPNTVLCNARVEIEKLEKTLSLTLKKPGDYFETVGGLVLTRAGYFPKAGSTITIDDNIFAEIIEANARSIKTVKLLLR